MYLFYQVKFKRNFDNLKVNFIILYVYTKIKNKFFLNKLNCCLKELKMNFSFQILVSYSILIIGKSFT